MCDWDGWITKYIKERAFGDSRGSACSGTLVLLPGVRVSSGFLWVTSMLFLAELLYKDVLPTELRRLP